MLGMVETRPRRGMIMAQPDLLAGIEKVLSPTLLSQDNLKDVFELRLILEMGISEFLLPVKRIKIWKSWKLLLQIRKIRLSFPKRRKWPFMGNCMK